MKKTNYERTMKGIRYNLNEEAVTCLMDALEKRKKREELKEELGDCEHPAQRKAIRIKLKREGQPYERVDKIDLDVLSALVRGVSGFDQLYEKYRSNPFIKIRTGIK